MYVSRKAYHQAWMRFYLFSQYVVCLLVIRVTQYFYKGKSPGRIYTRSSLHALPYLCAFPAIRVFPHPLPHPSPGTSYSIRAHVQLIEGANN